jgi:hypothetical protein
MAAEIEPVLAGARRGVAEDRRAVVVIAAWVARALAAGEGARLLAIGDAAGDDRPLVKAAFSRGEERSLPPRARLPDASLAVHADVSGLHPRRWQGQSEDDWRAWCGQLALYPGVLAFVTRRLREPALVHHDPAFIGRLLDTRWIRPSDVVRIASRRPTSPAIVLAIATRDRWFEEVPVRAAIAANPYTPGVLARVLGASSGVRDRGEARRCQAPHA